MIKVTASMHRWAQKPVVVLSTGYILFFYSERMFWSFLRPGDKVADILMTWVVYSILAWVVLGLACYGLRRNQGREHRPDLLEVVLGQIQFRSCLPLVLMPTTAIAVYAPVALFGLKLPTNRVGSTGPAVDAPRVGVWRR